MDPYAFTEDGAVVGAALQPVVELKNRRASRRGGALGADAPSDGGADRRAAAILAAEVEDRKRFGPADDAGVRAATLRADFPLRSRNLRSRGPRFRTPFSLSGI